MYTYTHIHSPRIELDWIKMMISGKEWKCVEMVTWMMLYIYVYVRDIAFLRTMAMGEYIPFYCFNSQICASHR